MDYVVDFNPSWLIGRKVIDATFAGEVGALFGGVSLSLLQLVCLVFAFGTWEVTVLPYSLICRWFRE